MHDVSINTQSDLNLKQQYSYSVNFQNPLLSLWPSRPAGAVRLVLAPLPRGGKHHGHLHGHPVPRHRVLCQQGRVEGHPGGHPEGGSAHRVLRGAQGVGEGPGEDDPGDQKENAENIKESSGWEGKHWFQEGFWKLGEEDGPGVQQGQAWRAQRGQALLQDCGQDGFQQGGRGKFFPG